MTEPGGSLIVRPWVGSGAGRSIAPRRSTRGRVFRVATTLVALALIGLWAGWWIKSLRQDRLASGRWLWFPILPVMAGDFVVHIDHTARLFASGGDLYRRVGDPTCAKFPYPPMVPRLFSWVSLLSTRAAATTWTVALALILAGSTWAVGQARRALGLTPVPVLWLLVAVLYSTPVLFAMERGQCDPLLLPLLGLVAWLARRRSPRADYLAGALLGVTVWIKYYPGLAIVALLALRRWRPLAIFAIVACGVGLLDLDGIQHAIANGARLAAENASAGLSIHPVQHGLAQFWPDFLRMVRWRGLAHLPVELGVAGLLLPAVLVVGQRLDRLRRLGGDAGPLLWPTMLWLAATATFALPYSNDYNLVFLPLAILAVWERRDPVVVPMALGLLMLWWQPFELTIDGRVLFVSKFLGLQAVAVCLVLRANERAPNPHAHAPPPRPHISWKA